jgi:hypothetical protein
MCNTTEACCCCYYYLFFSFHMFFLVLFLLNQWWTPPLRLQVSDCSTFLIICDVPSTVAFCRESIECFPGIVSRYFLVLNYNSSGSNDCRYDKTFHVPHSLNSILKFLYSNLFLDSFCITFLSNGIATSVSKQILFFLFLIIVSVLTYLCVYKPHPDF